MKKQAKVLLMTAALLTVGSVSALAGTAINFTHYGFPSQAGDIRIIDNRAYVPARDFAKAIGGKATFDNATKTLDYQPVDFDRLPPALRDYMTYYEQQDWAGVASTLAEDGLFINHDNPAGISGDQLDDYLAGVYKGFEQYGKTKSYLRAAYEIPDGRVVGIWEITAGGHLMATGAGFYTMEGDKKDKLKRVELFQMSQSPDEILLEDHSAAIEAISGGKHQEEHIPQ
ncbi:hypothetical protein [Paenibacillus xylaniclasticus]|uniref:hypothetical protein n=1 Tax=Paenibacillus xylaniclasticus TaxID=588083 RepID=UPI000FD9D817|nr:MULTISPECIES: hypothetical protein [Paenibacillus]GFN29925.1 hypothetical protein PCURB6_01850 [Paenibacillus curdlanolyticus]